MGQWPQVYNATGKIEDINRWGAKSCATIHNRQLLY